MLQSVTAFWKTGLWAASHIPELINIPTVPILPNNPKSLHTNCSYISQNHLYLSDLQRDPHPVTFVCMCMSGHCCVCVCACVVSLAALLPRIKKKKMHHSLFSIHRPAHIQTARLNRFLANTSCVDRRDELLFLSRLAEGTELGLRSKRAATVEPTKPSDLLLLPLPTHKHTHTLLYQRQPGECLTVWTGDSHWLHGSEETSQSHTVNLLLVNLV